MANLSSFFESFKLHVAKHYGKNPGKMLIHTGVIGWIMSSAAQIAAIIINDKIPKEQKMFMIPQEFADAAINILSFLAVTNTCKAVSNKLVKTGKWAPKNIHAFLKENKLSHNIGKNYFNVLEVLSKKKPSLVADYEAFSNGVNVTSTILGSVLSCNILTPVLRNVYASKRQKDQIARMNDSSSTNNNPLRPRPTMSNLLYNRPASGLKI